MKNITLNQEPYLRGGQIRNGIYVLTEWYEALGHDADGNEFLVVWKILDDYDSGVMEEDNACNWDKPHWVLSLDNNNEDVSGEVSIDW